MIQSSGAWQLLLFECGIFEHAILYLNWKKSVLKLLHDKQPLPLIVSVLLHDLELELTLEMKISVDALWPDCFLSQLLLEGLIW